MTKDALLQSKNKELEDIRGGTDSLQKKMQGKILLLQKDALQIPELQSDLAKKAEKIKNLETQIVEFQQIKPEIEKYKNEINETTERIKEFTEQILV